MIHGDCPQLHRQAAAAQVFEFVHVCFERKAQFPGFFQDLTGLRQVESAIFAKDIHKG